MRATEFITEAVNYDGYRGVGPEELKLILQTKHPLPSSDLMPFDNEIIEYGMGEEDENGESYTDDQIEQWVRDIVPWYDGSIESVKGGVNFTSDLDNAEGYGNYILALRTNGPVADFSDIHHFAKNHNDVDVVAYKKSGTNKWTKL